MPDPQRLPPGEEEEWERSLARDGRDGAGGSRQRGLAAARESSSLVIDTNAIVFAPPAAFRNNLKGIPIAYAPESGRIYVGGILTERVSVVDLATGTPSDTWNVGSFDEDGIWRDREDGFYPKDLVWAGAGANGRLWLVHTDGKALYCKAENAPVPVGTSEFDEFTRAIDLEVLGITNPVKRIAGDPYGLLFVVSDYVEGCDPAETAFPSLEQRAEAWNEPVANLRPCATPRQLIVAGWPGTGDLDIVLQHKCRFLSLSGFCEGSIRIKDVAFDPVYDWGHGLSGAIALLLVVQRANGDLEQWLYFAHREIGDHSSVSAPLPEMSKYGLVERLAVDSDGRIYVATSPNSYVGDNVDDVEDEPEPEGHVPGYLLGFERNGSGDPIPWFEEELEHDVIPTAMAHNEHTGRIALLYQRYILPRKQLWAGGYIWDLERQLEEDGLTNGLEGRYRSWVDIHEPDDAGGAPLVARFTTGIEAHSLVAIPDEPNAQVHEFAVGNAGGASVFLVPNLDTLGPSWDPSHTTFAQMTSQPVDLVEAAAIPRVPEDASEQAGTGTSLAPVPDSSPVVSSFTARERPGSVEAARMNTAEFARIFPALSEATSETDEEMALLTAAAAPDNPTGLVNFEANLLFDGSPSFPARWAGRLPFTAVPRLDALEADEVQVGTGPEYLLLSNLSDDILFVVSRLGGSQLIVCTRSGDEIVQTTYHGPSRVGYWPCGIAQSASGRYLYLLGHFDRTLRIVDAQVAIDAHEDNQEIVVNHVSLPRMPRGDLEDPTKLNPEDQISDSLSEMASSNSGHYHLALLAEVGEVHLVHTDEDHAEVIFSDTVLGWALGGEATSADEGPGRLQGALEEPGGSNRIAFWVLSKNGANEVSGPVLWRYEVDLWGNLVSRDEYDLRLALGANQPLMTGYSSQIVFYNDHRGEVIVGDTIWKRLDSGILEYCGRMGWELTGLLPGLDVDIEFFPSNGVRVVGAPTETDLLVLVSEAGRPAWLPSRPEAVEPSDSFVWVELTEDGFTERARADLPFNPEVKAACSWREVVGGLEATFTQAHEAKVYWNSYPWQVRTYYTQGSPAMAQLP